MTNFLVPSLLFFNAGLALFILGRLRLITHTIYIPLWISSFIFLGFYSVDEMRQFIILFLGSTDKTNKLLFYDYGNGLLGLLPLALATLLLGKYLLKMDYNEQWSGTTSFTLASLWYGSIVGILLAGIPLLVVVLQGQKLTGTVDTYRYLINCFSNLYEEVICRGLLLACCVKYWNRIAGVIWTSVVFGLAHGLTGKSMAIASAAGLMAWAVLKAKSLWAGWTSHQLTDMLVDTFVA